jgi:hypothetical protein
MAALDERGAEASAGAPATALEASEVVAYLRDLPGLWDHAHGSRRALAEDLFERVETLGLRRVLDRGDAASGRRGPRGGALARICRLWSGREGLAPRTLPHRARGEPPSAPAEHHVDPGQDELEARPGNLLLPARATGVPKASVASS